MLSTSITAITEDLYDQMVERATERIRDSLTPAIPEASELRPESVEIYARRIISGISEVKDLIYVMLKGDDGIFLRQLTDLIFEKTWQIHFLFMAGRIQRSSDSSMSFCLPGWLLSSSNGLWRTACRKTEQRRSWPGYCSSPSRRCRSTSSHSDVI